MELWEFLGISTGISKSYKKKSEQNFLMTRAIDGESPVCKALFLFEISRVPRDTGNLVGNWEDHLPKLNITQ